jgi:outer membrane lipoprotein
MNGRAIFKMFIWVCGIFLLVGGGACLSPISKSVRKEVDRSVSFQQIRQDPERYKGTVVLLGGTIAETKDLQKETVIEVLQKDLGVWFAPKEQKTTGGRFLVICPDLLDPTVYREGRKITVAGEIMGKRVEKRSDGSEYVYPVLRERDMHLWPDYSGRVTPSFFFGYGYDPYGFFLYDPYFYGFYPRISYRHHSCLRYPHPREHAHGSQRHRCY